MIKISYAKPSLVFFLGLAILASGISVQSIAQEEKLYYTLDKVIDIAQKQSPDALKAKHRFLVSYWKYRSFKASFLPTLGISGNLPQLNRSYQERYDYILKTSTYEFINQSSIDGKLFLKKSIGTTGGDIEINSGLRRVDVFSSDTSYFVSQPIIGLSLSQPIFSFNQYYWDKKIDPLEYEEAKRMYLEDIEQISISATNHFFDLFRAQIQKKIALINQANYDTLYKIALGRFNLGKIAENELLQLELRYLRANAAVDDAALEEENKLFRLRSFLRIKDDFPIELVTPNKTLHFPVDVQKAIEEAKRNRADAIAYERRLLESEMGVNMARHTNRFSARLTADVGFSNRAHLFDDIYSRPDDSQIITLGLEVPIIDWGLAKGNIKQAESNMELVKTSVEQERIDFEEEIFLKVMRFNMQQNQLLINAKADTVAQKGYEVTKARYLIGKISITDLNIAQAEKDNSTSNYIMSLWNYWVNYFDIRKLSLYDFQNNTPIMVDFTTLF